MAANSTRTLQWLKTKYSVNVRQEWLDACIQFVTQENSGPVLSQPQLNEEVLEQFLLSDLQQISTGSLPCITADQDITTIQDKHCLQINSLINVGQSAYSQIQKIKGNDDPESLQDKKQNNWEPKAKATRMLFLQLSDGAQQIQAMEYQPISTLNVSMVPGTKIIIEGPITCRLGVLLLTSKNVRMLGGSAEDLAEENSMWKVLHEAIGQEPPDPPASMAKIEDQDMVTSQAEPLSAGISSNNRAIQNTANQHNSRTNNSVNTNAFPRNRGTKETAMGQSNVSLQNRQIQSSRQNLQNYQGSHTVDNHSKSSTKQNHDAEQLDDYFMDDDDDLFSDEIPLDDDESFDFDQLDQIEQAASSTSHSNSRNVQNRVTNSHNMNGLSRQTNHPELIEIIDDDFEDDLGDFDVPELNNSMSKAQENRTSSNISFASKQPLSGTLGMAQGMRTGTNGLTNSGNRAVDNPSSKSPEKDPTPNSFTAPEQGLLKKRKLSLGKSRTWNETSGKVDPHLQPGSSSSLCSSKQNTQGTSRERNDSFLSRDRNTERDGTVKMEPGVDLSTRDSLSGNGDDCSIHNLECLPYTYLKLVLKHLPVSEDITLRIKAYIVTLVNHVMRPGAEWVVTVKINDGTATMDVDLGPEVLTELLQCPVESFKHLLEKAKKTTNLEVRRQFQQPLVKNQEHLNILGTKKDIKEL